MKNRFFSYRQMAKARLKLSIGNLVVSMGAGKLIVVVCALAMIAAQQAGAITLDFSNLVGTEVSFSGGGFSFTSTNGYQFAITSVQGGVGDSVGDKGYVNPGGPFTIGAISLIPGGQYAPVTGSGTLHITDSADTDLTGDIQWVDIETFGVSGVLNLNGVLNLTNITYTGASSDLNALAAAGSASDVVTFQFVPPENLMQLKTTGGQTSYSGSITATIPEPSTVTLVGMALLGVLAFRRRK